MSYELYRIESDMWSRCYFRNIETSDTLTFECNNNIAHWLLKKAFYDKYYFINVYQYLDTLNISHPEYYEDEFVVFVEKLIKDYPKVIWIGEFGTPIQSELDLDYTLEGSAKFSFEELYDLKYKRLPSLNFTYTFEKPELLTFAWTFNSKVEQDKFKKKSVLRRLITMLK